MTGRRKAPPVGPDGIIVQPEAEDTPQGRTRSASAAEIAVRGTAIFYPSFFFVARRCHACDVANLHRSIKIGEECAATARARDKRARVTLLLPRSTPSFFLVYMITQFLLDVDVIGPMTKFQHIDYDRNMYPIE